MEPSFDEIFQTLCRGQNDPEVAKVLERLGSGKRLVVERSVYVDYFDQGVCFFFDETLCVSTVFFYSSGLDKKHKEYKGRFPLGLRFGDLRETVREAFDQLLECGDIESEMAVIPIEPWDKFAYEGRVLHIQYACDYTVIRVTVSCGESQVESSPAESANGLMSFLRRLFKRKNPVGIKNINEVTIGR